MSNPKLLQKVFTYVGKEGMKDYPSSDGKKLSTELNDIIEKIGLYNKLLTHNPQDSRLYAYYIKADYYLFIGAFYVGADGFGREGNYLIHGILIPKESELPRYSIEWCKTTSFLNSVKINGSTRIPSLSFKQFKTSNTYSFKQINQYLSSKQVSQDFLKTLFQLFFQLKQNNQKLILKYEDEFDLIPYLIGFIIHLFPKSIANTITYSTSSLDKKLRIGFDIYGFSLKIGDDRIKEVEKTSKKENNVIISIKKNQIIFPKILTSSASVYTNWVTKHHKTPENLTKFFKFIESKIVSIENFSFKDLDILAIEYNWIHLISKKDDPAIDKALTNNFQKYKKLSYDSEGIKHKNLLFAVACFSGKSKKNYANYEKDYLKYWSNLLRKENQDLFEIWKATNFIYKLADWKENLPPQDIETIVKKLLKPALNQKYLKTFIAFLFDLKKQQFISDLEAFYFALADFILKPKFNYFTTVSEALCENTPIYADTKNPEVYNFWKALLQKTGTKKVVVEEGIIRFLESSIQKNASLDAIEIILGLWFNKSINISDTSIVKEIFNKSINDYYQTLYKIQNDLQDQELKLLFPLIHKFDDIDIETSLLLGDLFIPTSLNKRFFKEALWPQLVSHITPEQLEDTALYQKTKTVFKIQDKYDKDSIKLFIFHAINTEEKVSYTPNIIKLLKEELFSTPYKYEYRIVHKVLQSMQVINSQNDLIKEYSAFIKAKLVEHYDSNLIGSIKTTFESLKENRNAFIEKVFLEAIDKFKPKQPKNIVGFINLYLVLLNIYNNHQNKKAAYLSKLAQVVTTLKIKDQQLKVLGTVIHQHDNQQDGDGLLIELYKSHPKKIKYLIQDKQPDRDLTLLIKNDLLDKEERLQQIMTIKSITVEILFNSCQSFTNHNNLSASIINCLKYIIKNGTYEQFQSCIKYKNNEQLSDIYFEKLFVYIKTGKVDIATLKGNEIELLIEKSTDISQLIEYLGAVILKEGSRTELLKKKIKEKNISVMLSLLEKVNDDISLNSFITNFVLSSDIKENTQYHLNKIVELYSRKENEQKKIEFISLELKQYNKQLSLPDVVVYILENSSLKQIKNLESSIENDGLNIGQKFLNHIKFYLAIKEPLKPLSKKPESWISRLFSWDSKWLNN